VEDLFLILYYLIGIMSPDTAVHDRVLVSLQSWHVYEVFKYFYFIVIRPSFLRRHRA
jgi:hypothetical protein